MNLKKSSRDIREIIVHCTATREGQHITIDTVRKWHKDKGWNDIGYHYLVHLDGTVHEGRDVNVAGAHCVGHNKNSIGVCYVGGCNTAMQPKDTRTLQQKTALNALLHELKNLYPNALIRGHRDFAAKACPSFDATVEYANV